MRRTTARLVLGLGLALVAQGCGGCGDPQGGSSSGGTFGPPGGSSGGVIGASGSPFGGGSSGMANDPIQSLVVEPDTITIQATWGSPQTRDVVAYAVRQSGAREAVRADWSSDHIEVARVAQSGQVTIPAQRAGRATITATHEGRSAIVRVDVFLRSDRLLPGAPVDAPAQFAGVSCAPAAADAPTIVYPLNNVVLPLNLPSPLIQWSGGAALNRVRLEGASARMELYAAGPSGSAAFPNDLWAVLLAAHSGSQLTLQVDALHEASRCSTSTSLTIKLASADLSSTVYYWAVNAGQITRIDVGSLTPVRLDIGPSTGDGNRCTACHTLSRDGTKISFTYYGGSGPGGVVNPLSPQNPIVGPDASRAWNYAAFDNTGELLLTNINKQFVLRNAQSGDEIQTLPLANVAQPAWSPDGRQVAFAGEISDGAGNPVTWEIDFDRSNLQVMSFEAGSRTFGTPQTLVNGAGSALSYPSYNATSTHIIYQKGVHSRSAMDGVGPIAGDLELVPAAGGTPQPLSTMNPDHSAYMPTFSPFIEGGYQWVAFFSRRAYGHVLPGGQPQIWLAAIDENVVPGVDPSHPPFWLPGQDLSTSNLSSYFAPVPCREPGGECTTDVQCCNGQLCRPTADGTSVCTPPDQACSLAGEECVTDVDCCPGAGTCRQAGETARICSTGGQECRMMGQSCTADGECCPGQGSCNSDGAGNLTCSPSTGTCKQLNDACTKDEDCCPGAGFCIENRCSTPGG